jgi:hypothetical protein
MSLESLRDVQHECDYCGHMWKCGRVSVCPNCEGRYKRAKAGLSASDMPPPRLRKWEPPDAMDLSRIGEALADEFTKFPEPPRLCERCRDCEDCRSAWQCEKCADCDDCELRSEDELRVTAFKQHAYGPPPCPKRMDGDRLVELLDRLGFEIVRRDQT